MVRSLLATLLLLTLFGSPLHADDKTATPRPFVFGADISALATLESHGAVYGPREQRRDAVSLFRENKFGSFRLRLFVNPNNEEVVTNSLAYTVALARRVKDSGASFMLDIHYSDTWADPSKQFIPAAWAGQDAVQLAATVRQYTRDVLQAFIAAKAAPDYVQIGNEITNGMLWPLGKVEFGTTEDDASWARFTSFLKAGRAGLDDAFAGRPRPQTLIHIESTGNVPRTLWLYRNMIQRGVDFDIAGLSYYPEWHGTVDDLKATLAAVAEEFGKPVMVVETAYPHTPNDHFNGKPNLRWPFTPIGQLQFLHDVTQAVLATPHHLGAGVYYWYPECIQVDGLHAWVGGSCGLFNAQGEPLLGLGWPTLFYPKTNTPSPTHQP